MRADRCGPMKTRSTVFAATVAAIVLAASFVMIVSDDSSASDPVFSGYYYNQLNTDEKAVYDKLESLNLDSTPIQSDVVGGDVLPHHRVPHHVLRGFPRRRPEGGTQRLAGHEDGGSDGMVGMELRRSGRGHPLRGCLVLDGVLQDHDDQAIRRRWRNGPERDGDRYRP